MKRPRCEKVNLFQPGAANTYCSLDLGHTGPCIVILPCPTCKGTGIGATAKVNTVAEPPAPPEAA